MDALERLELYSKIRALQPGQPFHREIAILDDHHAIQWDCGFEIGICQVTVDPCYCEDQWLEFYGREADRWYDDRGFLKDMFWSHFETVQILPE